GPGSGSRRGARRRRGPRGSGPSGRPRARAPSRSRNGSALGWRSCSGTARNRYLPTMVDMDPELPPRPDRPSLSDWERLDLTPTPIRRRGRWLGLVATLVAATVLIGAVAGGIDVSRNVPPRGSANDYRFLSVIGGRPVRWNPCEPIHYVIDPGVAPQGSLDDVYTAIARISAAAGITFVYDGLTSEIPERARSPVEPTEYG